MWDYCAASFAACTDFRVGEAIRYFRMKECAITLLYKASCNPKSDERELIRELQVTPGVLLLNGLAAYDYRNSSAETERAYIQRFCNLLISKKPSTDAH